MSPLETLKERLADRSAVIGIVENTSRIEHP